MKTEDLLLTATEQEAAKRGVVHTGYWHARDDAICRAQAAKVLAVLEGEHGLVADVAWRIALETGLTWPPEKEKTP